MDNLGRVEQGHPERVAFVDHELVRVEHALLPDDPGVEGSMHWTTFVSTAEIHKQPPTTAITWPPSSTSIVEMTFPRAGSILETLVSK